MRSIRFVESRPSELTLNAEEAATLRSLGQQFASTSSWWGVAEDSDEPSARTVIQVAPVRENIHRVTVMNMVGVIRLANLQLEVGPKIAEAHFLHLARQASRAPRTSSTEVAIQAGSHFADVLAGWFLDATERLLRRGLRPDYLEFEEELPAVRGHLMALETALAIVQARPVAHCRFEELSEDAPLNRVIKAACQKLVHTPTLQNSTRTRARRVAYRIECSAMHPTDLLVRVDRASGAYKPAVQLAHLIHRGLAVCLQLGTQVGSAFLIRTPELIEAALRSIVKSALPDVFVTNKGRQLGQTGVKMNPDLVFNGGHAVGDIKYRHFGADWRRSDLYQAVAFATAFRSQHAAVIGFESATASGRPPAVQVGTVHVQPMAWHAEGSNSPEAAEHALQAEIRAWWSAVRLQDSTPISATS